MIKPLENKPFDNVTLRLYEIPISNNSKRELVKKLCLSCGLLSPYDRRDVVVDVFLCLLEAKKNKTELSSVEMNKRVIEIRKEYGLKLDGTAESNTRRILKMLRDYGFIEKIKARYRFIEFRSLSEIFDTIIDERIQKIIERNKKYMKKVDELI